MARAHGTFKKRLSILILTGHQNKSLRLQRNGRSKISITLSHDSTELAKVKKAQKTQNILTTDYTDLHRLFALLATAKSNTTPGHSHACENPEAIHYSQFTIHFFTVLCILVIVHSLSVFE